MNKKILQEIRKMAVSSDWQTREGATGEIKEINDNFFLEYLPVWKNG
ncbi:MAG: hypothetical protein ACPL28_09105 [bacterium]